MWITRRVSSIVTARSIGGPNGMHPRWAIASCVSFSVRCKAMISGCWFCFFWSIYSCRSLMASRLLSVTCSHLQMMSLHINRYASAYSTRHSSAFNQQSVNIPDARHHKDQQWKRCLCAVERHFPFLRVRRHAGAVTEWLSFFLLTFYWLRVRRLKIHSNPEQPKSIENDRNEPWRMGPETIAWF